MSAPRFPDRDLRLERLGDRDGQRPAPLGETAHAGSFAPGARAHDLLATYEALIDAVFLSQGAAEWLRGLRATVAEFVARPAAGTPAAVRTDAIRAADPGPERR